METADWNVFESSLEHHRKIQCEIETDSQTADSQTADSQTALCVNKKK